MKKVILLIALILGCLLSRPIAAAPVVGVGYQGIASVSWDDLYNGLSDGSLTYSAGWDFPGILAIDLFYKKFNLYKDIKHATGDIRGNLEATMIGPMFRIHHGPYVDSRFSLFYSKLETDYRLNTGAKVKADAQGKYLGVLAGVEGHLKFMNYFETYLGTDLMRIGGEILSLSFDLGVRWYVSF